MSESRECCAIFKGGLALYMQKKEPLNVTRKSTKNALANLCLVDPNSQITKEMWFQNAQYSIHQNGCLCPSSTHNFLVCLLPNESKPNILQKSC